MANKKFIEKYLKYNNNGTLTRVANFGSCTRPLGETVGTIDKEGYLTTKLAGKTYKIHRLVYILHFDNNPQGQIDHINGIRNDNRIENLRVVTNRQNCQNWKIHREGSLIGAQYHKASKKWRSRIYINGVNIYLGLFKTPQEANEAYNNKLKELTL